MPFNKPTKTNDRGQECLDVKALGIEITNVRVITDTCVSFTMRGKGISLYGMKLVETADGKRFIAPPSVKGSNGNYYNQYAVYLSDDDQKMIMDQVVAQIEK